MVDEDSLDPAFLADLEALVQAGDVSQDTRQRLLRWMQTTSQPERELLSQALGPGWSWPADGHQVESDQEQPGQEPG